MSFDAVVSVHTYAFLSLYLSCTVVVSFVFASLMDFFLLLVSQSSTKELGVNVDWI